MVSSLPSCRRRRLMRSHGPKAGCAPCPCPAHAHTPLPLPLYFYHSRDGCGRGAEPPPNRPPDPRRWHCSIAPPVAPVAILLGPRQPLFRLKANPRLAAFSQSLALGLDRSRWGVAPRRSCFGRRGADARHSIARAVGRGAVPAARRCGHVHALPGLRERRLAPGAAGAPPSSAGGARSAELARR